MDGKHFLYNETAQARTLGDIFALDLNGGHTVRPLIQTEFQDQGPELSPDGRWLAYQSAESGDIEVYVRPFPATDTGRWQISVGGGSQPLWSRDGRELFYLNARRQLTVITVQNGSGFSASTPRQLLDQAYVSDAVANSTRTYDVSSDGRRFLMIKASPSTTRARDPEVVVVLNWTEELKRLVPTH